MSRSADTVHLEAVPLRRKLRSWFAAGRRVQAEPLARGDSSATTELRHPGMLARTAYWQVTSLRCLSSGDPRPGGSSLPPASHPGPAVMKREGNNVRRARSVKLIAGLAAAALALAACSSGSSSSTSSAAATSAGSAAGSSAAPSAGSSAAGSSAAPSGGAISGGATITGDPAAVKMGMAYDIGGRGDQSFNDLAAKALDQAKAAGSMSSVSSKPLPESRTRPRSTGSTSWSTAVRT